jgi:hypothetical protein
VPDHPFTRFGPAEQWRPLRAAAFDPRATTDVNQTIGAGSVNLIEVFVPETFDCSTVWLHIGTAGVALANSFAGIYDDQGVLIAKSTDQSTPWQSAGNIGVAVQAVSDAGVSGPVRLHAGRRYYVAVLVGSATTTPAFRRGGFGTMTNIATSAPFRNGLFSSGLTTLPASINYASVTAQSNAWWAGLS